MAETQTAVDKTKVIYKEVFDTDQFDNVTIGAEIELPVPLTSLGEVQAKFQGDETRLLKIVNAGMIKEAEDNAGSQTDLMWRTLDGEGALTDNLYDLSKAADSDKKKNIDAIILNVAKVAFGFTKNEGRDESVRIANNKAKDAAKAMIRANQAMLDGIRKG